MKKRLSFFCLMASIVILMCSSMTVNASTLTLNKVTKTIYVGDNYTLKVSGTSKTVKWSSNNKLVATVNSKGKVTANRVGVAVIKAKVGKKTLTCTVKTIDYSLKLNKVTKTIYVGDNYTLKVSGTSKTVKWSSNNKLVATVNSKGKVTAKDPGVAVIKAKVGKKTLTCTVKTIYYSFGSDEIQIKIGSKYKLPKIKSSNKITYHIGDTSIATVTSNGTIEGIKNGKTFVDVTIGNTTSEADVIVIKGAFEKKLYHVYEDDNGVWFYLVDDIFKANREVYVAKSNAARAKAKEILASEGYDIYYLTSQGSAASNFNASVSNYCEEGFILVEYYSKTGKLPID